MYFIRVLAKLLFRERMRHLLTGEKRPNWFRLINTRGEIFYHLGKDWYFRVWWGVDFRKQLKLGNG